MKKLRRIVVLFFVLFPPGCLYAMDSFIPGEKWPDNNGIHINAHGGGIIPYDGKYYWVGEDKGPPPDGNVAKTGVHIYESDDLYHWHDGGLALRVSDNPASDIASGCRIERPKIIFNEKTRKFIMWFHLELKGQGYGAARTGVAISDNITGPFTFLSSFRPDAGYWPVNVNPGDKIPGTGNILARDFANGQMSRDMTLYKDDDGKGYLIYVSEENKTLHIAELSDDYTHTTGRYTRIFPGDRNEAPAVFKHNGYYYMITSGQSGWSPNAARSFMAKSILGPWVSLGNPVLGSSNDAGKTFFSQSTYILPVPGEPDKFIFMGDRWTPKDPIDGRYVWLPLKWEGDRPVLYWADQWRYQDAFAETATFRDGGGRTWTAASRTLNWINPVSGNAMPWPQGGFAIFKGAGKTLTVTRSADSAGKNATDVYFSGAWFASDGQVITGNDLVGVPTTAGRQYAGQTPGPDELIIRVGAGEKGGYTATIDSVIREADKQVPLMLVKTDSGRLILNGANQYRGGTRIDSGILQVFADKNLGAAGGPLIFNSGTLALGTSFDLDATRPVTLEPGGGVIDTAGHAMTLSRSITGPGGLTKLGSGSLTLSGKNSWSGGTRINGGTLIVSDSGNLPFAGEVNVGSDGLLQLFSGQTVGSLSGSGQVALEHSVLSAGAENTDGYFAGLITGPGAVIKDGNGTLTLAGVNTYTGSTGVNGGRLVVNGSVTSDVTVQDSGVLSGSGRTGAITIRQGGTVSPGNSVGTLMASGDVRFEADSNYAVEVSADGRSDLLATSGRALLRGGEVSMLAENTGNLLSLSQVNSLAGKTFHILDAAQGVSGQFSKVIPGYLFLGTGLSYDNTGVTLSTDRNSTLFSSVAKTPNERAIASALETLPTGQPVRESVLASASPEQASAAFHALTGQIHADITRALTDETWLIRETLTDRMRGYVRATMPSDIRSDDNGTWVRILGNRGHARGSAGDAGSDDSVYGVLMGNDNEIAPDVHLGLTGGYTRTSLDGGYNGSADADSWHAAGYGSWRSDALTLRGGAGFTWHRVSTDREVAYGSQHDRDTARYNARSGHIFADTGYEFFGGSVSLEPYAAISFTSLTRDGFSEKGGAAALRGDEDETHALISETGVRGGHEWQVSDGMALRAEAGAGWQHYIRVEERQTSLQFGSGNAFFIRSPGTGRDDMILQAGLSVRAGKNIDMGINYSGKLSGDRQSNSAGVNISWRF